MWNIGLAPLLFSAALQAAPKANVDWTWDRDTPTCSLQQAYSADGETISISRTPGNDHTSLYLGPRNPIAGRSHTISGGKVTFLPGGTSEAEINLTEVNDNRRILVSSEDSSFLSKLSKASDVELALDKLGTVRVPLRSAAAAVVALQKCEDSRMREWGIDPVAWHALKSRPLPVKNPASWFTSDDYPIGAVFEGLQGDVISRLEVGPDGTVTHCTSLNRNRRPNARNRMCDKLKNRARFRPALDSSGRPVSAPYVVVVSFRLL
jgi:hypothetical protein